jgi:hypothetical protein
MKLPLLIRSFAVLFLTPILAWSDNLAAGSFDVQWDLGKQTCPAGQTDPIQIHRHNAQTIVMREKLCATWEAPFLCGAHSRTFGSSRRRSAIRGREWRAIGALGC